MVLAPTSADSTTTSGGGQTASIPTSTPTATWTIAGTVTGLSGTVVMQLNSGEDLTITTTGDFIFKTTLDDASDYAVDIVTQPDAQTCVVSHASGAINAVNISNILVTCSTNTYTVGGTVTGLGDGESVVLQNNSGDDLTVSANGAFTFATVLAAGTDYSVSVLTAPAGKTCSPTQGTGTVRTANVTLPSIVCSTNSYTVGGTASGLGAGKTVVLQNSGGDNLSVTTNGAFTFSTPIAYGGAYNVTVLTQPSNQTCSVSSAVGSVTAAITSVVVTCVDYSVGGTVSGLSGTVVLQNNGGDNLSVSSNGSFTFATHLAMGAIYNVTVLTQPFGETCSVSNGSGTMGSSNVTNVSITCSISTYSVGGTASGLGGGKSVVLQNNGGNNLTVSANGSFTFTTPVAFLGLYNVTVLTQPVEQTCTIGSGSGMVSAAVTSVTVSCVNFTTPTITFNDITKYNGDIPFRVTATSNSPGTISYTSSDETVALVSDTNLITIWGVSDVIRTTTIRATQATSDPYGSTHKDITLTVNPNPCDLGICQNGGLCTYLPDNGYSCECFPPFSGAQCDQISIIDNNQA